MEALITVLDYNYKSKSRLSTFKIIQQYISYNMDYFEETLMCNVWYIWCIGANVLIVIFGLVHRSCKVIGTSESFLSNTYRCFSAHVKQDTATYLFEIRFNISTRGRLLHFSVVFLTKWIVFEFIKRFYFHPSCTNIFMKVNLKKYIGLIRLTVRDIQNFLYEEFYIHAQVTF